VSREDTGKHYYIQGDIESFKSPIDGRCISDRRQLRLHNLEHGVTDSRDYSPQFIESKRKAREAEFNGSTAQAKRERINALNDAFEKLTRR